MDAPGKIITDQRNQFTLAIACHWCGNTGSSLWERTASGRQLVSLDGF
ncbi:MAG TPA: hypothetical protein VN718_08840 [Rhizomicrobium sp.]|nr:hypothetical protein [Rhizomicrobium sp.]